MSILDYAASTGWAMFGDRADQLVSIAERAHTASPQILESYKAQTLERAQRAKVRDGTAILYVDGPLFKKASFFTEISGATSYDVLMKDLQVAVDDPEIHSIMLSVDSPGGEANGCDELAAAIFAVRGKKPIETYVSGMAASGGYWVGSASDKMTISEGAVLGSIGVVLGLTDRKVADEKNGVKTHEFVSSQSPGKRPDPNTKEGSSQIQTMVNDLADVFLSAVATFRGVTVEQVMENFGAGGVKVGAKAVASGMADKVGSFEGAFAALNKRGKKGRNSQRSTFGGPLMSETQNNGPTADEIAAKARTDTQARMKTILSCDDGKKLPTLANHLAFDTNVSADDAGKILASAVKDMPKIDETKKEEVKQPEKEKTNASFEERRAEAGALGLGQPDVAGGKDQEITAAGWGKAVKAANASLGIN